METTNLLPSTTLYNHLPKPSLRRRVYAPLGDQPSRTKQEFKDDCDINRILARFQRTGALAHLAKYGPQYGDFSACDYQEAQNLILRARQMFDDLPSSLRREVATPEGFLTWIQDPANREKMATYGLLRTPAASPGGGSGATASAQVAPDSETPKKGV